jgi:hypothetical protein
VRDGMAYINLHWGGLKILISQHGDIQVISKLLALDVLKCMDVILAHSKA